MTPTSDEQIQFLVNMQRLLAEGQFSASYKFALLHALADLAVEHGDDTGDPLILRTRLIAEKFVDLYWRQAAEYPAQADDGALVVLLQNTGRQAAVVRMVTEARTEHGASLAKLKQQDEVWQALVGSVSKVVHQQPLWKLQTVGTQALDFLYTKAGKGKIELHAGVVFCLRKYYGLVTDIVRGAWLRYVRKANHDALGDLVDLPSFLFGIGRASLEKLRPILLPIQNGNCFYCGSKMIDKGIEVDHFIPWSAYPVDLGHNFVLAHKGCNNDKSDHLAAEDHLAAWVARNRDTAGQLGAAFDAAAIAQEYLPDILPLPHPAWRSKLWMAKHSWFETDVLPVLRAAVTVRS